MKIESLHIDGFGIWNDRTWAPLAPGLNVFYGPNETGKSTLMAFIRSILFGLDRRGQARRYEPLNGGTHAIEVTAPGYERWAGVVTLQNEADHKTLALPLLERESSSFIPLTGPRHGVYPAAPPPSALPEANSVRVMRQASLAMGIGSAVAVGFGVTFGIAAKSRNDASNRDGHCDATGCDIYGSERRSAALDAATISTWSFVTASALGAGAIVLYFSAESKSARLATSVVDGAPRVSLSGSF